MKYLSAVLLLMAAATCQIRADYLNWTYTATFNVPGITVNTPSSGGATVTITDFNTPQAGGTSIPVQAYVTTTASTTPIDFNNATYNLALKLTDSATNNSRTLNFTGSLSGALSTTTSSVVDSFTPVATNWVSFDGHTYTVTIPSVTLVPPTSPQQDIMASVSVTNTGNVPPPSVPPTTGTPEPTSLLLGSLGFSLFGVGYLRRARAAM